MIAVFFQTTTFSCRQAWTQWLVFSVVGSKKVLWYYMLRQYVLCHVHMHMHLHMKMDFNSHGTAFRVATNVLMLLQ